MFGRRSVIQVLLLGLVVKLVFGLDQVNRVLWENEMLVNFSIDGVDSWPENGFYGPGYGWGTNLTDGGDVMSDCLYVGEVSKFAIVSTIGEYGKLDMTVASCGDCPGLNDELYVPDCAADQTSNLCAFMEHKYVFNYGFIAFEIQLPTTDRDGNPTNFAGLNFEFGLSFYDVTEGLFDFVSMNLLPEEVGGDIGLMFKLNRNGIEETKILGYEAFALGGGDFVNWGGYYESGVPIFRLTNFSTGYHEFAFVWREGGAMFFVDGDIVYVATEDESSYVPTRPLGFRAQFMAFNETLSGLVGSFSKNRTSVFLRSIRYVPGATEYVEKEVVDDDGPLDDENWWIVFPIVGGVIGGLAVFVVIVVCVILVIIIVAKKLMKKKIMKKGKGSTLDTIKNLELKEETGLVASMTINKDLFKINMDEISVDKKIGEGGFGTVYSGTYSNMEVALKIFDTKLLAKASDGSSNSFENFEAELQLIGGLNHENIVRFYGATLKPPRCGLVLEYCPNGDLQNFITVNSPEIAARVKILFGVVKGMVYLSSKKIIHRDLKPENVLLGKDNCPKITDFGLSRLDENDLKTRAVGTSSFMSPEVFLGESYDVSSDVFSFAIIIHNVLSMNFQPFESPMMAQRKMASSEKFRPPLSLINEKIRKGYGWLIKAMQSSWKADPKERPTFNELFELFKKNM